MLNFYCLTKNQNSIKKNKGLFDDIFVHRVPCNTSCYLTRVWSSETKVPFEVSSFDTILSVTFVKGLIVYGKWIEPPFVETGPKLISVDQKVVTVIICYHI